MGIRVDADALRRQLKLAGCEERAELPFQKAILESDLPLHNRRRYRSVPYLYVLPAQGAYRRGTVLPVAG